MSVSCSGIRLRHGFLALPFCLVLLPLPFLYGASLRVMGVPLALVWLFACLPLTTLCLALAVRPGERETDR
ncbi:MULTISPECIES: DUF3311 domain-containing protein [Asaia]|uniref:DUF3311 domain-containing protein n=2 Tax=Asaia TaxID=91914 RepID=A0ABQ1L832_9PROT|nr:MULTISPECIES: DUF3311 domain-containing protein [Asaia]GBR09454.1 hypothetical protein AA0323_2474 [Asaia siamensis NRIC 0323]GBR15156.1 hypothetical protein AA105894_1262 [Asaia spathodeae NBRC 105894]GGC19980.1 hypothetical protein GCM10007207_01540 [Asaia siamensis]